jgi:putative ABC transport system permease protein
MGDIPREVVGVVGDVKHSGLDAQAGPELYVPYLQKPFPFMTVVVRTTSDPLQTASALRGALLSVDSSQPVYGIKTMDQIVSESMSQSRLYSSLLATFAALAVTLAAVGIYGVMSYNVSQRAHEIGIRMALGAERRHILRLIVGEAMTLAVLGVLVGLGAAVALTRVMETLVFGVGVRDAATFAAVPVVLGLVAFLSCYVPARRATEVDPMIALRYE